MSFREIEDERHANNGTLWPVAIGLTGGTKRLPRYLFISLRPTMLRACDWLVSGGFVRLMLGEGPDAGKLRLTGRGSSFVRKAGRGKESRVLQIRSTLLAATLPVPRRAIGATTCEFEQDDDGITIVLPSWAWAAPRADAPVAAVALSSPAPEACNTPFKGLLAGGVTGAGRPTKPIPLLGA
jgi:hypothetical protein